MSSDKFIEAVKAGYTFKGKSMKIGTAMSEGSVLPTAGIYLPLKYQVVMELAEIKKTELVVVKI